MCVWNSCPPRISDHVKKLLNSMHFRLQPECQWSRTCLLRTVQPDPAYAVCGTIRVRQSRPNLPGTLAGATSRRRGWFASTIHGVVRLGVSYVGAGEGVMMVECREAFLIPLQCRGSVTLHTSLATRSLANSDRHRARDSRDTHQQSSKDIIQYSDIAGQSGQPPSPLPHLVVVARRKSGRFTRSPRHTPLSTDKIRAGQTSDVSRRTTSRRDTSSRPQQTKEMNLNPLAAEFVPPSASRIPSPLPPLPAVGVQRVCSTCEGSYPKKRYSATQWKKDDGARRCKDCTAKAITQRVCSACEESYPEMKFSATQWKKDDSGRRCKDCTAKAMREERKATAKAKEVRCQRHDASTKKMPSAKDCGKESVEKETMRKKEQSCLPPIKSTEFAHVRWNGTITPKDRLVKYLELNVIFCIGEMEGHSGLLPEIVLSGGNDSDACCGDESCSSCGPAWYKPAKYEYWGLPRLGSYEGCVYGIKLGSKARKFEIRTRCVELLGREEEWFVANSDKIVHLFDDPDFSKSICR